MNRPANLFEGRVLLLSPPGSFSAAYIKRSLQFCGVAVLTPPGDPMEAFSNLHPEEWETVSAVVVVDLGRALFADVSPQQPGIPFLFVGYEPGYWFPGPYSWLAPPFASHQVFDTLTDMMTASMKAMLDLTTAPSEQPIAKKTPKK